MKNKNREADNIKVCKGCGKPLPENYKHKKCEACMGRKAAIVKKAGKGVAGVALAVAVPLFNGKITQKQR